MCNSINPMHKGFHSWIVCALLALGVDSNVRAEELPYSLNTTLGSTTVSGSVNTTAVWHFNQTVPMRVLSSDFPWHVQENEALLTAFASQALEVSPTPLRFSSSIDDGAVSFEIIKHIDPDGPPLPPTDDLPGDPTTVVPEPGTLVLSILGLGLFVARAGLQATGRRP